VILVLLILAFYVGLVVCWIIWTSGWKHGEKHGRNEERRERSEYQPAARDPITGRKLTIVGDPDPRDAA